jgi:cell division protein FtsB
MSASAPSRSDRTSAAFAALQHRAGGSLREGVMDVRDVGLRLVNPVRSRARRAPFVVVVLLVLSVGLVGLIVGSTVLQSQSFQQAKLDKEIATLHTQQQSLSREVDRLHSPGSIADSAGALGMVRNTNPAFLRLSDGKVLGKPKPAEAGNR